MKLRTAAQRKPSQTQLTLEDTYAYFRSDSENDSDYNPEVKSKPIRESRRKKKLKSTQWKCKPTKQRAKKESKQRKN